MLLHITSSKIKILGCIHDSLNVNDKTQLNLLNDYISEVHHQLTRKVKLFSLEAIHIAITTRCMPKIIYTGALSSLTLEEIDTYIDTKIRSIYRQASNNMDTFPNALLTISIKRGGLGIPSAALHINIHKQKIINRYLASHGYSFALMESIILNALYRQGCSTPNCKYAIQYYHVHKNTWIGSLLQLTSNLNMYLKCGGNSPQPETLRSLPPATFKSIKNVASMVYKY